MEKLLENVRENKNFENYHDKNNDFQDKLHNNFKEKLQDLGTKTEERASPTCSPTP